MKFPLCPVPAGHETQGTALFDVLFCYQEKLHQKFYLKIHLLSLFFHKTVDKKEPLIISFDLNLGLSNVLLR